MYPQKLMNIQSPTVQISYTTTASTPALLPAVADTVIITNLSTTNPVYVSVSTSPTPAVVATSTASVAATCIPAGAMVSYSMPVGELANYYSAIAPSGGSGSVVFMVGEGV